MLEEQKYLPKLLPILKPINSDNSQSITSDFDYYEDDFSEKYNNHMNEKNYHKNNINNYFNKNRFNKNNNQYYNRNYYNNRNNYFKNNNNYSYNSNIKINETLNKDFEEFKFFQEFINLKYAPLYYKNYKKNIFI